jgi:two-component system, cell cycle sensor histidine kinase and response regulator CckA
MRLQAVGEAATNFGEGRIVSAAVSEALDSATAPSPDEVSRLAGGIRRMMGDIQQANTDLRASEAKLRGLYELSPLGIALNQLNGQFIESNQAFLRICGYSGEELTQLDYWTLTPRKYEADEARQLESLERDGFYGPYEKEYIARDGRHIPVRLNGMLLTGADGRKYIWSIIEDITDRKRSEERLRLSEENLAITLQSIGDAVIATDTAGLVTRMNPVAESLTGWTLKSANGQPLASVFRIVNADTRAEVNNPAEIVLTYGKVVGLANHTVLIARDGREYQIADSAAPIRDAAGNIMGVVLVFSDVTQRYMAEAARVSLEDQLRESQKMEAIGTLAGGIAHDFNNIIATILGNAELAFLDAHKNPQSTQESVDEIRKAARRARDLVNQILTFSRRQPTERKVTSLENLVNESVRLLRATLPARIVIEVNHQPDLPLVLADATQIEQVVINLATNAMQAIRGKPGRIRICLDTVIFDSALMETHPKLRAMHDRHTGPFVRLTISDDGGGMDAATLARIFEPFFTTKPPGEGTGLGLSVAHGIVQTHEGAITVDSTPGKGTTFSIYLPPADANAAMAASSPGDPKTVAIAKVHRHILYLDDDEALAYLVTRLLERHGHRVSSFVNQIEALASLRGNPSDFDLVVTDYNMPGMSGLDIAREVNLIRADLPVAVASGFIDDELRAQAKAAGVRELIFKTSAVEDLSAVIERLAQAV